ncbi:DUF6843 domain-containing protein [Fictibacillus sp. BK138]|uniref:DUF6843 domain-containing protein n=1 Tax=Fictibacillus sp. BK138 TaxID=2512121 RepID=UPI00102A4468|nr:hypothetical protein [Fictibacillus sp. BK138]RZT21336.1 hypothetical protein EV282_0394 [Fictibacillus sp. BK138]
MNKNFTDKCEAALYSSIIFILIIISLMIPEFMNYGISWASIIEVIPIFIIALLGSLFYGIPVSLLSEKLTKNLYNTRFLIAGFIHMFFGFLTILVIKGFGLFAVGTSLLFFLCDEWLKREKGVITKKIIVQNGSGLLALVVLIGYLSCNLVEYLKFKSREYYLIPEGYVGKVTVLYNVEKAPELQKIKDYKVIKVNDEGYALTSLSEPRGEIDNKYYYVDKKGKRTEIDYSCIHDSRSGGHDVYDFIEFKITDFGCGETFIVNGKIKSPNIKHSLSVEEILQREGLE